MPTAPQDLPRVARRLLAAVLPAEHRAVILAHLQAECQAVARQRSIRAARWWFRWQVLASLPGALRLRTRAHVAGLGQDAAFGWRLLLAHPVFALAVTVTLALGVGATSAMLTLANAVLLRPLPFHEPDRIVTLSEVDRSARAGSGNVSWPDFLDYAAANNTLASMAGHDGGSRTLQVDGSVADRVTIASVTPAFFDTLGVVPFLGRPFTEDDGREGASPVVILTDAAWRARFGADPAILGRRVIINGIPASVVGVWPPDFEFPPRGLAELWLPLRLSQAQRERKYYHWMNAIGRLKPGVTIEQARQDLDAIARRFAVEDPQNHASTGMDVTSMHDSIVGESRPVLLVLSWASVLVLLVACANVAGLLLARGASRRGEIAVRGAIGASRWRLARQLFVENVVLACPGGVLGCVAGQWAVTAFVAALPDSQRASLPHLNRLQLDTGAVVLGASLLIVMVVLFGLVPALRTSAGGDVSRNRGTAGQGRKDLRLQLTLVATQVALALMLLSGAGLMTRSVSRLLGVSPGFATDQLLTFRLSLSGERYDSAETVAAFFRTAAERLAAVPGVRSVTAINQLPLTGRGNSGGFAIPGDPAVREHETLVRTVAHNYFTAMGIALEGGRGFDSGDRPEAPRVVLINRRLADQVFAGRAVGQRLTFPWSGPEPWEVVGVVGDEQFDAIDRPILPVLYFSAEQSPTGSLSLLVRTASEPLSLVPAVRAAVAAIDPGLPVFSIRSMGDIVSGSEAVFRRRAVLLLLGGFSVTGLLLAAVGIYGVLAQLVNERTREIGVRIALGAGKSRIVLAVLRRGLLAASAGMAVGAAGTVIFGRALGQLLFDTTPTDGLALSLVLVVFLAVTVTACLVPSRRVLRIDPAEVLRGD